MNTAALWASRGPIECLAEADAQALRAWLTESPKRHALYEALLDTWQAPETYAAAREVEALIEEDARSTGWLGSRAAVFAVAASVLCAVLLAVVWVGDPLAPEAVVASYQSDIAERRAEQLEDGSNMELNARSMARVSMEPGRRRVELLQGEAFFNVIRDPARPFSVEADGLSVTVVGTQFNVNRIGDITAVSVYEGVILLQSADTNIAQLQLQTGERAYYQDGKLVRKPDFDPDTLLDWRSDWVEMEDEPLSMLLAELNRYSQKAITIQANAKGDLRVGGRFRLSQIQQTLELVAGLYDFDISEDKDRITLRPAGAASTQ